MKRTLLALLALMIGLALVQPSSSSAQNEDEESAQPAEKETDSRGPLPIYYGKLGLDEEQREHLYGIQNEYKAKIEAIEQQIARLEQERDTKMEVLLTPGQKLRLKELREEAARKKAEDEAKAAEDAAGSENQ